MGCIMDIKELFLIQKENEHQGTLSVYSKIPHDCLDWCGFRGKVVTIPKLIRSAFRN